MPLDAARWQIDILAADKTAQAFASVDKRMKGLEATQLRMGSAMSQGFALATRAIGPLLAGLSAVALAQQVLEAGLKAGGLGEQAEQLGVTTDELQAYRLVAIQAGVGVEQLDGALMKLTKAMGSANDGDDEMIAKFDKLGVKVLDANGELRRVGDVLPELSRGLLKIGSDTERNAMLMELMGRSGSRMATMLKDMAGGSEELVASARRQGVVISGETISAWDELGDRLDTNKVKMEAMLATLGRPIASAALAGLTWQLQQVAVGIKAVQYAWDGLTGLFTTSSEDLITRRDTLEAMVSNLAESTDAIDVAKLAGARQEIERINETLASRARVVTTLPAVTVEGAKQPTGKKASAAGEKLDERLKQLQNERAALERAIAAFDVRGTQTVDDVERRLNAQVALDKKIFDVLKDVPPNSPLAQQLVQEATAVSQLNQKLDELKRLLADGERVVGQFGDGSAMLARESEKLNELLKAGAIDAGTFARAMEDLNRRTSDQERAARGAAGGWGGFIAGIEQGMADMSRANSTFELGRRSLQSLDEVIDALAGTSNKTFGQIALDFGMMLLKMEASAQASNLFNLLRGSGPTNQGILGGLFGGGGGGGGLGGFFGGLFGGGGGGLDSSVVSGGFDLGWFADGGDYPAGKPRVTGEKGWELDIPRRPGTILNQDQLAGLGGPAVNMAVTMNFGSDVDRATLEAWGNRIMTEIPGLAVRAILDAKSSSSSVRNALRVK